MNRLLLVAALASTTLLGTAGALAAPGEPSRAGDRCESAVADTVRRMRGQEAQEVEFVGAKRVLSPSDESEEIGVKGEGRYRGRAASMAFTYSCAYNVRTGMTSGVVFRETGAHRAAAGSAWEPDLTKVMPEECETAAASQLKRKYPRVARIAFGADTRHLRPAPNDHTSLEGEGAVQRAPGMHAVPFRYRCEIETRSGKVVSVHTTE